MSRAARRERSISIKSTQTFSTSGNWQIPYGKSTIVVSGKGANGAAAYGGNYAYDNSSYTAASPTTATYVGPTPTTATYVGPSPTSPSLVPGTATPPTNYITVGEYAASGSPANFSYSSFTSNTCPSPTGAFQYQVNYTCTPGSNSNPPNASYYTANPPNAAYYTANPPNAAYYTANPPNAEVYFAGNVVYNPYVPATTGSPATFLGVTFPGGAGVPSVAVNAVTVYVPYSNTAVAVVVPSNSYVNVQVK